MGLHRTWRVGDAVDASWALVANHGGGYQYRLCPADSPLTEACFQQYLGFIKVHLHRARDDLAPTRAFDRSNNPASAVRDAMTHATTHARANDATTTRA